MNRETGSTWSKWDLHVHTPASIEQQYGGDNDPTWDRFLDELERLPPEFKVIGVNDYLFLDGYKRLRAEKSRGRLGNVDLLLPVIELRIDRLAGTDGHFNRINFHVIFSDELHPEQIERQFIGGLSKGYRLSPEHEHLRSRWRSLLTRDSLTELGELIRNSVPANRQADFRDSLREGFNNFNVNIDNVRELLSSNPIFEGKYLTAVGKTEWALMRWNNSSIAEKKDIVNQAHMLFTAAETPERWRAAKQALTEARVNDRLLDCSDAHTYSSSGNKDRLGNCFTWIKADTTFDGLRQALNEPDERIDVCDEPDQVRRVRENKTKYMNRISVTKVAEARTEEKWFDINLPLNPGLVAIIGNRGMGKSALADILALLGDANSGRYSFLDEAHFRSQKGNKAQFFQGTLQWESGRKAERCLNDIEDVTAAPATRYVPQNLFEEICNELPGSGKGAFSQELNEVIFSHVKEEDRLQCSSLEELIDRKTQEVKLDIDQLRTQLRSVDLRIAQLEREISTESREALEDRIRARADELRTHDQSKPQERQQPTTDTGIADQLSEARSELARIDGRIQEAQEILGRLKVKGSTLQNALARIDRLKREFDGAKTFLDQELGEFPFSFDDLVEVRINLQPLAGAQEEVALSIAELQEALREDLEGSLTSQKAATEQRILSLQGQLEGPALEYQKYLGELRSWTAKREQIVGSAELPESLTYLEDRRQRLQNELPRELESERAAREGLMRATYRRLGDLADIYRELHQPVQEFLDRYAWVREQLKLEFGVSLEVRHFADRFLGYINAKRRGSFQGGEEGRKVVLKLLQSVDFNSEESVVGFVGEIIQKLDNAPGGFLSQLRDSASDANVVYDYLFSLEYIFPQYTLNVGGRGLESLSPGERGMLLLVFYLLVDRSDIPLIIDQPEENLDNQSVFKLLVPCIKEVRSRRQIILVTHNPNLAVVCDAEQVIHAHMDKDDGNKVTYTAGSIENPEINRRIVDVLEGTWPAFRNRSDKYGLFPDSSGSPVSLQILYQLNASTSPVDAKPQDQVDGNGQMGLY